jgi:hypothetical protein
MRIPPNLESSLRAERFGYTEAAEIVGVQLVPLANWVRRGSVPVDHPPRAYRPQLSINDLFRLFLLAHCVRLGVTPENAKLRYIFGGEDVFEAARSKSAGTVHWYDEADGCMSMCPFYKGGESLERVGEHNVAILIPHRRLAQELIQRTIDFLARQEQAQAEPGARQKGGDAS